VGTLALASGLLLSTAVGKALAAQSPYTFPLVVSAGAKACLPRAAGRATITPLGPVEKLQLDVIGLPRNTDFDFFVIQLPTAPFGLSWYQGDLETNSSGTGSGEFIGRFSIETFIVSPGSAPNRVVFRNTPFPDVERGPATGPVHTYHLGLWFNSPDDARKAGCPNAVTPFNGTHTAGIQVLNTANFPALEGPLFHVQP
jgi:hypothetical protein